MPRNESDLRDAAERINQHGGRATYVARDVADDETMDLLVQRAVDEFGALDTWVNNAGIGLYGAPRGGQHWGVVNGCKAAVRTTSKEAARLRAQLHEPESRVHAESTRRRKLLAPFSSVLKSRRVTSWWVARAR
jgi:NAD(P)-dependent dehydrogenase (short-subunit alcohol dehydrogenase family)